MQLYFAPPRRAPKKEGLNSVTFLRHFDRSVSGAEKSPAEVCRYLYYFNSFRPYLSAKPTVGRFALGPPHNVTPWKKIKAPFSCNRIRSREISRLTPPDDETKYRFAWFAGGRGRPPLPRSIKCKYGHRRLAYGGSPSGGRGRPPLPYKASPLGEAVA